MVRIGYQETYELEEIKKYIEKYGMVCLQKMENDLGYQFIEVETQALMIRGLCCFGRVKEVYREKEEQELARKLEGDPCKERI